MSELHDEIMEHVGKVLHDYFDEQDRQELFAYGDNPNAIKLEDKISELTEKCCEGITEKRDDLQQKLWDVENSRDEIIGAKEEAEEELEDIEQDKEWAGLVAMFRRAGAYCHDVRYGYPAEY